MDLGVLAAQRAEGTIFWLVTPCSSMGINFEMTHVTGNQGLGCTNKNNIKIAYKYGRFLMPAGRK
jgi:hypothetical protein